MIVFHQVFDFRTSLIISKLKGRHVYEDLNGYISTGKEVRTLCIILAFNTWM